MSTTRWTAGALAALVMIVAAGVIATASPPAAVAPDDRSSLVVHEWGTFSSFSGADGVLLRFHPANTDLPKFVYRGRLNRKDQYLGTVSLETPVLYFYSDRPLTAAVRAEFPGGAFTDWFPQAERSPKENSLSWTDIRVRPAGPAHLPTTPGENHYYAARETDAAPLEVGAERREQERFLFYRGVGNLRPPLTVAALGGGAFYLRATGEEPIASALLMEARAGQVRFRLLDPLPVGVSAVAELPASWSPPDGLRAALVGELTKAGLYEKEARAMVKTWESAWFGEDGMRVLYTLPTKWTDRALPLRVTPTPDSLVRVLVGRHDILTPEREREIDGIVRQLKGTSREERSAAAAALGRLGRFAGPARQQAEGRLAGLR